MEDKRATMRDAVREIIRHGDSVVLGACLEPDIPFAATHEIIRQGKRDLDMIAPISDGSTDMLIGAGCVSRVTGAWVGNATGGLGHNYRRAMEKGEPNFVRVKDHSNFSLTMALLAGAYGMPYAPNTTLLGSDILRSNPEFRMATDPFSGHGEPVVLIPALRPDVAVLAVQRADRMGNCHHWGCRGVMPEAALAAKRLIVVAEELVEPEVIASDPDRVPFPGFLVSAVVHEPAAVHPSPMAGVWKRDTPFADEYHGCSREPEEFGKWLQEWVLDLSDHAAYREKLGDRLAALRIRGRAWAAPTNFAGS